MTIATGTIDCGSFSIDNNGVLTTNAIIENNWTNIASTDKIRELELRVEVLENKIKEDNKNKYKIVYGE